MDLEGASGGPTSKHTLIVDEFSGVDCSGSLLNSATDEVVCCPDSPARSYDWHEGLDGDGDSAFPHCHRPDVVFLADGTRAPPDGVGTLSYRVAIRTAACGTTCTSTPTCSTPVEQIGCLNVVWKDEP
jgi:hypothetical protein